MQHKSLVGLCRQYEGACQIWRIQIDVEGLMPELGPFVYWASEAMSNLASRSTGPELALLAPAGERERWADKWQVSAMTAIRPVRLSFP